MNRKLLLLLAALLLAGCSARDSTPRAGETATRVHSRPVRSKLSAITLLCNISPPAGTVRVKRLALSSDGSLVAAVINDNIRDRLRIWRSRDGHSLLALEPDYGLTDISWRPSKPLLAFYGATGEPMTPDAPINRGFGIVDATTKHVRSRLDIDLGERVAFDWLPDGSGIATSHFVLDTRTWHYRRYDLGNDPPSTVTRQISVSCHHDVARETASRQTGLPNIRVFRSQTSGFGPFTDSAGLSSATDLDTNNTVIRTQPRFLASGDLAFVKASLDPYGLQTSVEVWTCRRDCKDERPWVRIPRLGEGAFGPYSFAPVACSADGRVVAYVYGLTVRVFRVASR